MRTTLPGGPGPPPRRRVVTRLAQVVVRVRDGFVPRAADGLRAARVALHARVRHPERRRGWCRRGCRRGCRGGGCRPRPRRRRRRRRRRLRNPLAACARGALAGEAPRIVAEIRREARERRRVRDRHLRGVRVRRDREPLVVGAIGGSPGDSGFKGGGSGRRGGGGGDRRGPRLDPRDGGRRAVGAEAHLEPEVSALGEPREVAADAAAAARGGAAGGARGGGARGGGARGGGASADDVAEDLVDEARDVVGARPRRGGARPRRRRGPRARGVVVAGRRCGGVRGVGVRRTLDHQEGVAVLDARVREALVVREDATAGDEALARGGHAGDARERLLQRADLGLGGTRRGERGGGGRDGVVSGDDGRRGGGGGGRWNPPGGGRRWNARGGGRRRAGGDRRLRKGGDVSVVARANARSRAREARAPARARAGARGRRCAAAPRGARVPSSRRPPSRAGREGATEPREAREGCVRSSHPPSRGGGADGPGRSMPLDGARRAAVMKKTRTTRVCGTKTTRPERLSRDPSISPDSNVSGGVALQFVRFPSGRGRALGVHDRARSPPRAPTPRRGRDPRTPRVDRAEASLRRCVPSPRLLAGARSSIDPVVVVYGLLRGPAGVLVDAPSPARSRARRAPLPSP